MWTWKSGKNWSKHHSFTSTENTFIIPKLFTFIFIKAIPTFCERNAQIQFY